MSNVILAEDKFIKDNLLIGFLEQYGSANTRLNYKNDIIKFFKTDYITAKMLNSITFEKVQKFIKQQIEEGKSKKSIERYIASLKSFYEYCLDISNEVTNRNWFASKRVLNLIKLNTPQNEVKVFDILENEEIKKLIDIIDFRRDRILIRLLINLCLRRSEVIKLKWNNFKLIDDKYYALIEGKGRKQKILEINNNLVQELKEWGKDKFCNSDEKLFDMSSANVDRIVKKYVKKLNIDKHISSHSLKRSIITNLLNNKIDQKEVSYIAAHSDIKTTINIYQQIQLFKNNPGRYLNY